MQTSCDGNVRFIGRSALQTKDGRPFYLLNVADEDGDTLKISCEQQAYEKLASCVFGDAIYVVFRVKMFNNNLSIRCIEVEAARS